MHTQLADYFMRESMCSSNTCKAGGGLDFYHILEWHLVAVSLITPQPLIVHYSSVQGVFLLTYLKQDLVFCLFFCLIVCVSLGQYRKWFVLREILPSVGSKTVQEHENADRQCNHFLLSLNALKQMLGNILYFLLHSCCCLPGVHPKRIFSFKQLQSFLVAPHSSRFRTWHICHPSVSYL